MHEFEGITAPLFGYTPMDPIRTRMRKEIGKAPMDIRKQYDIEDTGSIFQRQKAHQAFLGFAITLRLDVFDGIE